MDGATGYILGTHLARSLVADVAKVAVKGALRSSLRPCDEMSYFRVRSESYNSRFVNEPGAVLEAIREALPEGTVIVDTDDSNVVFPGPMINDVLRDCANTYKPMGRRWRYDSRRIYTIGWVINRNLFTAQEGLRGRTPASAAGISAPFADWAAVVRLKAKAQVPASDP